MPDVRHPLVELTITRFKEFWREPEAVFWVFAFPLLLTLALGFAFRETAPEPIAVGIVQGPTAQQRLAALSASPTLKPRIVSEEEGRRELRRGNVILLVDGAGDVVYRYDSTRPDIRTARLEVDDALQRAAGRRDVVQPRIEQFEEEGSRYVDFLVPGLLGMNLMGTGMWGIGFNVVNARMKKLLKRLVATPMRRSHYLLSHFLSRLLFLVFEVVTLILFAWLIFDVRIAGSTALFLGVCLVGGFAFSGLGLLVASRAKTIEAVSGLMNLVMMPMWVCSGIFFSYERFPDVTLPFIRLLPLTALVDALRGVMNDAMSIAEIAPELAILAAWGVLTFGLGLKLFKWQ